MKKIFRLTVILLVIGAMLTAVMSCGSKDDTAAVSGAADTAKKTGKQKIGIISMVENGAFVDMKNGIISGLNSAGFIDGENVTIDYKCAQGDATNLNSICQGMADGSYDLVFTIATPATQGFVGQESKTPGIFCSVSSPTAAGVITDMSAPDKNVTGTSNFMPVDEIFEVANTLTPGIKYYGLLYCTSEVNAVSTMKSAKTYLDNAGVKYKEVTVTSSAEVQQAAQSLVSSGVDAVFIANDSVVQSAVPLVVEACNKNKIPTYCCSATTVASGCLATYAMSDTEIGELTAEMGVKYLKGTPIKDIPAQVVKAKYVSVNRKTLEALGIKVSDNLVKTYGDILYK